MNKELKEMINDSILSDTIIMDTYYVQSNPAKIESIEVIKVDSILKKLTTYKSYDLISIELPVDKVSYNIDKLFIESLDLNCKVEKIKYFNRGFIKNLFKRDSDIIIDKITDCSWIITSYNIVNEFISAKNRYNMFNSNANVNSINRISPIGKIGDVYVYVSSLITGNEIYLGNSNSITSILNENILNITDNNNFVKIDYLFISNGIKKIVLE